jgi:hypothetical protein
MDPVTRWLVSNFLVPSIFGGIASLFGRGKGIEATPMTPEEEELYNAAQKTDNALRLVAQDQSGVFPDTEGIAPEAYILDAYDAVNALEDSGLEFFGDTKDDLLASLAASGFANIPTLGGSTKPTLVETTQENINKAASAVGKAQDTLFDIFDIPKPDYSVIQPNAPGATVIWGEPSGGVFGRIGTTPGGTVTGVQTGIPALDVVLGKVADVVSGRTAAGEVLTTATIREIILQTAGDALGIPGDPNKILAEIEKISSQVFLDDETGQLGIDLGDGPDLGSTDDLVPTNDVAAIRDIVTGGASSDSSVIKTGARDIVTGGASSDRAVINTGTRDIVGSDKALVFDTPTLSTGGDRTLTIPDFDPFETERTPTLTTDEVPTPAAAAGVGLSETGGVRTVSGGPGDLVDIDYLFDFAKGLDQPFLTMDEQENLKNLNIYAEGGPVKKFFPGGQIISGLSDIQKGLLGAAVGGIFGGLGGSGDTQGSQGYAGGIPALTASRDVVPNAFAMGDRRPGEAGRRYFSDVQYNPITDATGAPTIMGGAELAAMNQAALDRQKELSDLGQVLMGTYGQKLISDEAVAEGATQQTTVQQAGGAGVVPAADGNGVVSNSVLDGFGEVVNTTGTTVTDDSNAAFNSFISPFYNQSALSSAQLIALGDSGYDLSTIASALGVDATALSNAITSAAQTQSIFDAVDPADGFSREEQDSIANLILGGQIDIEGVANQFEGVSDMDVIEGMLRGGYETPAAMTERLTPRNTGFTEVELMGILLGQGRTTPEELAAYYGNNPDYPDLAGVTADQVRGFAKDLGIEGYAQGGDINGYYLGGTTDGMADQVPATIDNRQPAALSDGEFVIPADVVSHLGNGNSDAGAQNLYSMMDRIRTARTGNPEQGRQIDPNKYLA